MLSKILTSVLFVTLIGCESKEYKQEQNQNIKLISELNAGDSDAVVSKLDRKAKLTPRERSYLASALSSKGGVDVFSLYSILEMQLFRKNALEWSDLSKEKNPYLKFMKSQEGVDFEKRAKKREERWNKLLPKIMEKHQISLEKPTPESLGEGYYKMTEEEYQATDDVYQKEMAETMKLAADLDLRISDWNDRMDKVYTGKKVSFHPYALVEYYTGLIHLETMKHNYLHPEEKATGAFADVQWEMLYMNILWNTYESIPLMKQLPSLSPEQQEYVTRSLDEYRKLVKDPEFGEVAVRNIIVLAGVSLLSIYKESFDLEEVSSIQDLMCSFEPDAITGNYALIRRRVLFLAEVSKEVGEIELVKQYEKNIDELKTILPEDLTEEQRASYHEDIEKSKVDSCFNG